MAILTDYGQFRTFFAEHATLAADGLPEWPLSIVDQSNALVPFTNWYTTGPFSYNTGIGSGEYHWYLAQPTETTVPRWEIQTNVWPVSRSVTIALTTAGTAEFAALLATYQDLDYPDATARAVGQFMRGCYIYAKYLTGPAIYVGDFYRSAFAAASMSAL